MPSVTITHPAPDGNGTSVLVDDVEMNDKILMGTLNVEFRGGGLGPVVGMGLFRQASTVVELEDAEIVFDERTTALLEAAGWTAPEVQS